MPESLLVSPQKSLIHKDAYTRFAKKNDNQIHVDNLPKKSKSLTISDTQGSETPSKVDSIIFFLKRFMDQF